MLYKPIFPTPYNNSIDASKDVIFSANYNNNADNITKMTLIINDNYKKYYYCFESLNENSGVYIDNNSLYFKIQANNTYSGYQTRVINDSIVSRTSINSVICGSNSDLLKNPLTYSWQVRLYQNNCDVNIAYGFIQEVIKSSDDNFPSTLYNSAANCVLKVRPHTNVFFANKSNFNSGVDSIYYNYYDTNVNYAINIGGISYDILGYYYSSRDFDADLDSYGNPLFAYIEINVSNDTLYENDDYSIYTNYIDSNEYYFKCLSSPVLNIYDVSSSPTIINSDISDENDNALELSNSCLNIIAEYLQDDDAYVNYYECSLYQITNDQELLIDNTGSVYSKAMEYNYNLLLSGNLYKFVMNVVDSNRVYISRSFYVKPQYNSIEIPKNIKTEYYPEHASIIVDFNDLISISGKEYIDGEHYFSSIEIGSDSNIIYEDIETDSGIEIAEEKITVPICNIYDENYFLYNNIDGTNNTISFDSPLLSIVFRCNGFGQQDIIKLVNDNGDCYSISWDGKQFVFLYKPNGSFIYLEKTYSPYNLDNVIDTSQLIIDIKSAISVSDLNYDVPYLALEDLTVDENYYCHTEDAARDFWWQIILIDKTKWYVRCLNTPVNYTWDYEG